MENHPIPQNVTGFQFKLIGEMTLKQFGYFAAGVICAWITISLPIFFVIKFPIALFFVSVGFSLAFLPFEGRPLDIMFFNFVRSLFTPNQFVYQKIGRQFADLSLAAIPKITKEIVPQSSEKLEAYLKSLHTTPKNQYDEKEMAFFQNIAGQFSPQPQLQPALAATPITPPLPQEPVSPLPPVEFDKKPETNNAEPEIISIDTTSPADAERAEKTLEQELEVLTEELQGAKKEESQTSAQDASLAHQRALDLEKKLTEVLSQKKQLEEQILHLSKRLDAQSQTVFTPSAGKDIPESKLVRKIPKAMGQRTGLLASEFPNVVSGITKDSRGNVLPNILVEIKDKNNNPVRAFKTNTIGQFASATPLANGTYTIQFEDPSEKHAFDTFSLTAKGEVIQPLEIVSTDAREELRKELFGT